MISSVRNEREEDFKDGVAVRKKNKFGNISNMRYIGYGVVNL